MRTKINAGVVRKKNVEKCGFTYLRTALSSILLFPTQDLYTHIYFYQIALEDKIVEGNVRGISLLIIILAHDNVV